MVRQIIVVALAAMLVTCALTFLFKASYPFVLASEEARTSLTVTNEQLTELKSATQSSDRIAFGIAGILIAMTVTTSIAGFRSVGAMKAIAFAALGGLLTGVLAAPIGHWFDNNPAIGLEGSMAILVRWMAMLSPLAIVCGISFAIGLGKPNTIANSVIGALLGLVLASCLYSFASGVLTIVEDQHKILPQHDSNRALIFAAVTGLIGVTISFLLQLDLARQAKTSELEAM
ncbi:MAG: hypothetical protein U0930_10370 [Pirellulales bacterium]